MEKKLAVGLKLISCIYPNCRSSIPVELFNVHLARCRRKWLGATVVCPYNGAHVVPVPEERYHEVTCSDQQMNEELSGCEEKIQEVTRSWGRSGKDTPKKQGYAQSGVIDDLGKSAYSYRGRSYPRWRNVGPRLQKQHEKQYESVLHETVSAVGRGERSIKFRWPPVTEYRGGHRPGRGLAVVGYRKCEGKISSISVSSIDDLPAGPSRGFSPWASTKEQSPLLNAIRSSWATRGRASTVSYGIGGRRNGFEDRQW